MSAQLTTATRDRSREKGFSLVELMVTLAISSALIGGIFSVYLNTRTTRNYNQANSRVQELGRFSLELLKRDIQMIGYRGCISYQDPVVNVIAQNMPPGFAAAQNELLGFEIAPNWANGTVFASVANITTRIKTGSDAFNIGRMASISNQMAGNLAPNNANIKIAATPDPGLEQNDLVFISDCASADIFRVTNNPNGNGPTITLTHGNGTNTTNRLSKIYQQDATIAQYQSILYFIGDTGRTNNQGGNIFALYQATNNFNSATPDFTVEELIEGVENLQLLYGEVLANGNTRYLKATEVTDMTQVSSIKIGVLLASQNNARQADDVSTYTARSKHRYNRYGNT